MPFPIANLLRSVKTAIQRVACRLVGLSNGLRDQFPEQQFHYTIISRDGLVYNGQSDVAGIGDLALSYKAPIYDNRHGKAAAWRVGLTGTRWLASTTALTIGS